MSWSVADVFEDDTGEPEYPEIVWRLLLWLTALAWLEQRLAPTFYRLGIFTLRWGMALIFLWFGALKLFVPPPVTAQFTAAIPWLPAGFPFLLGLWEVAIGVCFLRRAWMRIGIIQLKLHMPGTFIPLLVIPDGAFAVYPLLPALPGLYILKNIIFIGGTFILWYDLVTPDPLHDTPTTPTPPRSMK